MPRNVHPGRSRRPPAFVRRRRRPRRKGRPCLPPTIRPADGSVAVRLRSGKMRIIGGIDNKINIIKPDLHFVKQRLNVMKRSLNIIKHSFNIVKHRFHVVIRRPAAARGRRETAVNCPLFGKVKTATAREFGEFRFYASKYSEYSGFVPGIAAPPCQKVKRWLNNVKGLFNKMKVRLNFLNGATGDGMADGSRTAWVARRGC